jgi:hypothetical protein
MAGQSDSRLKSREINGMIDWSDCRAEMELNHSTSETKSTTADELNRSTNLSTADLRVSFVGDVISAS